jgi:hypothetical protein
VMELPLTLVARTASVAVLSVPVHANVDALVNDAGKVNVTLAVPELSCTVSTTMCG